MSAKSGYGNPAQQAAPKRQMSDERRRQATMKSMQRQRDKIHGRGKR